MTKDELTKELLQKYPLYKDYKHNGGRNGGWGITTLERRHGTFNGAKEFYGLEANPSRGAMNYWTEKETQLLYENMDKPMKELTELLPNRPVGGIRAKMRQIQASGIENVYVRREYESDEEVILQAIRDYPTKPGYEAVMVEKNLPSIFLICQIYGGWREARIAAGLSPCDHGLDGEKPTTVYLIHFPADNIYKVGITQNTVEQRGAAWPPFEVLELRENMTLNDAIELEKSFMKLHERNKQYYYEIEGNGATECFYFDERPTL